MLVEEVELLDEVALLLEEVMPPPAPPVAPEEDDDDEEAAVLEVDAALLPASSTTTCGPQAMGTRTSVVKPRARIDEVMTSGRYQTRRVGVALNRVVLVSTVW